MYLEQGQSVQYFAHQFFTINEVLNRSVNYEKNEQIQIQQANLLKCQTLLFHIQHINQIHLHIYSTDQQVSECLVQKNDAGHGQVVLPQQLSLPRADFLQKRELIVS